MNRFLAAGLLSLCTLLSGCGTTAGFSNAMFVVKVTAFHELASPAGVKFAMVPFAEQDTSLEHKAYARAVSAELQKAGMQEVPVAEASLAVFLRYGIDNGREVASAYPIFGQTGVASSTTYGNVSSLGNINATTYNTPSFGVVGSGTSTDTVFRRFLDVEMLEASSLAAGAKPRKLYEAKVRSDGASSQLARVMPYMVQGLFKDFPGQSGKASEITIDELVDKPAKP